MTYSFIDTVKTTVCKEDTFIVISKRDKYRAKLLKIINDDRYCVCNIDCGFVEYITPRMIYELPSDLKTVCTQIKLKLVFKSNNYNKIL